MTTALYKCQTNFVGSLCVSLTNPFCLRACVYESREYFSHVSLPNFATKHLRRATEGTELMFDFQGLPRGLSRIELQLLQARSPGGVLRASGAAFQFYLCRERWVSRCRQQLGVALLFALYSRIGTPPTLHSVPCKVGVRSKVMRPNCEFRLVYT